MAAPTSLCRLCITMSTEGFKSLYDEYGRANDLYEMTCEYFHPKIVNLEKAKHLTCICLECFRHIHDFHSFQTSVTIAQLKLIEEDKIVYSITEAIETPQTMAIKVEEEEDFIGLTPECIMEEYGELSIEEDFSSSSSKNNQQIISDALSNRGSANEEEDNISLPMLEISAVDTSSTYTIDNVISLVQAGARNPPLSENWSPDDGIDTQTNDSQILSHDQLPEGHDTLDYLLTKWIPNIKCSKCSKSFPSWPILNDHFQRRHPDEIFHYTCCSRKFNVIQIKDHLRLHDDPEALKCSICGKRYISSSNLAIHYAELHPESLKFSCDKCDKRCVSKQSLVKHYSKMHSSARKYLPDLQIHHSSTPATNTENKALDVRKHWSLQYLIAKWMPIVKCCMCSMSFPSWSLYRKHFKSQHPNEEFLFICCSRKFTRFQIKDHLYLHSDPNAFKCIVCGKLYTNYGGLAIHYTVRHPENLKFPCDKCGKRFISKYVLTNHQRKMHKPHRRFLPDEQIDHSAEPTSKGTKETTLPVDTEDCTFISGDETSLVQVVARNPSVGKSINSGSVPIQTIDNQKSSYYHPRKNHDTLSYLLAKWIPNIKCYKCLVSFPTWQLLKIHFKRMHPNEIFYYICCRRKFPRYFIKDHLLLHDDPDVFKCSVCGKRYNSRTTLRFHYTEKHTECVKFPCDKCGKHCVSKNGLKNHQRKMHNPNRQFLLQIDHSVEPTSKDINETTIPLDNLTFTKVHLSPQTMSEVNNDTTEQWYIEELSCDYEAADEDRKNNIYFAPWEIMDVDTGGSTFSSDNEISLAPNGIRNPSVSKSIDSTEGQKSSSHQLGKKHETLDDLLDKWIPNIKCFKCSKFFPSWRLVKVHFKDQHPENEFYYKCCSKTFKQNKIEDHLRLHSDPNAFKCSICRKRYSSRSILATHNSERHPESLEFARVKCDKCDKCFMTEFGLATHHRQVHQSNRQDHVKFRLLADGRPTYTCQLCGEIKYSKSELSIHKLRIHGSSSSKEKKQLYKCAFCPRTYGRIAAVNNHRKLIHPFESNTKCYINIGEITNDQSVNDSASKPNKCPKRVKSTWAASTEKYECGVVGAKDNLKGMKDDRETEEEVNTDCETNCDGEIEQKNSTSLDANPCSVAINNEDCDEECAPPTSVATTAYQPVNKYISKKRSTRTRPIVRLPPKRRKRSQFGNPRKNAE